MKRLAVGAFVAAAVVLGAGSVAGDERIILRKDNFGPDFVFIDRFLGIIEPDFYEPNGEFGSVVLTRSHIRVGRHDINNDGADELFVFIRHAGWCGRNSCNMYVFERLHGEWVKALVRYPSPFWNWVGDTLFLTIWTDPETGYQTVYATDSGFRWTGETYEHIDDARILELQAESYDFANMDNHLDNPVRGALKASDFDPDKVRYETDWNRGALRHLAPLVGTYRYGAVINDPAISAALGGIMDRRELTYVILFMTRVGPIHYDRGYVVLEGSRIGPDIDESGHETVRTAMIVVDTRDGSVHAGARHNRDRTLYSLAESYAGLPPPLYEWLNGGERSDFPVGTDQGINVSWVRKPQARE